VSIVSALRSNFDAEILKSLRWQYFLNIGIGVLGAAYILSLSRLLGPESFGTYTLCAAFPAVAAAMFDYRLQEFVLYIRENCGRSEFPRILAALFWFDALSKLLVVGLALAAFAVLKARGYEGIYFHFVLLSSVLIFVGKSFSGPAMGTLRSCGKLEYFSTVQVTDWFFRLLALAGLFLAGRVDIPAVLWSQIVIGGLFNAVVVARAMREIGLTRQQFVSGPRSAPRLLRENARLIFANQGISATDAVVKELDVLVSGIFLTTSEIATYKVAKSMAAIAWRLADPVLIVIMPKMARLHSLGRKSELQAFVSALTLALTPSAVVIFTVSVAGVFIVGPFVLGPEYAQSIALFPLASAWILVALPLVWTHSLSIASGKPGLFFAGGGLGNGIGLLAILLGASQFGIEGALVGLSLAFCLPFVFSFVLLRHSGVIRSRATA
jgi:O-antigen/teichoic acid export membrane protein